MHTVEMLTKNDVIEEKFFTKVTPGMRQNLSTSITRRVTVLNMITQLLNMVDALLADKHCATLETDQTKCLLVCFLHVAPQTFNIGEMLFSRAIIYQAGKCPQLHPLNF